MYSRQWPHLIGQRLRRHRCNIGFFASRTAPRLSHSTHCLHAQKDPRILPARALSVNCGTGIDSWNFGGWRSCPKPCTCSFDWVKRHVAYILSLKLEFVAMGERIGGEKQDPLNWFDWAVFTVYRSSRLILLAIQRSSMWCAQNECVF